MKSAFEIRLNLLHRRLDVVMRGVWDLETLTAFQQSMRETLEEHRASGQGAESLTALIDMTEFGVQPQAIAAAIRRDVEGYERLSRHIALVISESALQRMQIRRIAPQDKHRFFTDFDCAEQWLRNHKTFSTAWSAHRLRLAPELQPAWI